jgi:4-hydroxy-3-methylbut-2-en-1-yl diphosphate reductase
VKAIAARCDAMYVIGAPNSSNSLRLVEVAEREGTPARLIQRAEEIDFAWLDGVGTLGLTAGASAPEVLVREVVDRISERFSVLEEQVETARESVAFKLPRGLEAA